MSRVWKRFHADRTRPSLRDHVDKLSLRSRDRDDRWTWVLRDVDFTVGTGEAVGIVGSNGAGKSTLLKVLTGVMYPYAGEVDIGGRVGALIEIRGGMHPDLTGRENTYVYGTLLGLSRQEVRARFDEIVEFADLSTAIDRQLKYYSSGMQMRLGFAVAAFLRPHVLLVDEVLAVGDAWFQQRCLNRMREVLQEGTTLVFVSHDLASMEATCSRSIWLDMGVMLADGSSREVLSSYRAAIESYASDHLSVDGLARCIGVSVDRSDGGIPSSFAPLLIDLTLNLERATRGRLHVGISEGSATPTVLVSTSMIFDEGVQRVQCEISDLPLPRGRYSLWLYAESHDGLDLMPWHPAASFEVAGSDLDPAPRAVVRLAPVHVSSVWARLDPPSASNGNHPRPVGAHRDHSSGFRPRPIPAAQVPPDLRPR